MTGTMERVDEVQYVVVVVVGHGCNRTQGQWVGIKVQKLSCSGSVSCALLEMDGGGWWGVGNAVVVSVGAPV